jgi:hypothetical protein
MSEQSERPIEAMSKTLQPQGPSKYVGAGLPLRRATCSQYGTSELPVAGGRALDSNTVVAMLQIWPSTLMFLFAGLRVG